MLVKSLKRKKSHVIIVGDGIDKQKLLCHEEQLQACFPGKDVPEMDENQLILLLLTNTFNIYYKEASMYVTSLQLSAIN